MDKRYYVYVLRSKKDNKLYTGHTNDLKRRILDHNSGKLKSTSHRRPLELVHSEAFQSRSQARWRERFLKTAWGKKKLKSSLKIKHSPVAQLVERVAVHEARSAELAASTGNRG